MTVVVFSKLPVRWPASFRWHCAVQVRSLAGLGHDVMVISGAPQFHESEQVCEGAKQLIEVALPKWGSLDAGSAWQEFAVACADPHVAQRVAEFAPDAVLGVDWTSFQPCNNLRQALRALSARCPPYVFLNYRCKHTRPWSRIKH